MRIKEAALVLVAMGLTALLLAWWRFGGGEVPVGPRQFTLQLSWRAQAESGGFVQAAVRGFYRDCGLNVVLRQGGAGMDPAQLLVGGAVDSVLIPQDDGILHMNQAGFPARGIFASIQHSPSALDVHPDSGINSFADMRGHPIMISASSRNSWWPFVRVKYGFSDDQIRSYTGQRGPFLADRNSVIQDMISNGPYIVQKDTGMKVRTFMLTDIGYDPYGGILTVPQSLIDKNPAAVRCLVQGSQRGWEDFMRDPRPGFAEIRRISPEVSQGLLEFAYRVLRDNHLIETPDTRRLGFGAMTDERLSHHARTLFSTGVLPEGFDYRKAFNASFITPPPAAPSPPIGTPHP